MPNTYTQIYIHVVFAVKNRNCLINKKWKSELYKYATGIIQNQGHKVLQINGVADHVHVLIGMKPSQSLSELVKYLKQDTTKWINKQHLISSKFSWQSGFGAFSYSKSQVPNVINYIQNQEEHHKKKSFTEEYIDFLNEFNIDYNRDYIFKEVI